MYLGKTLRIPFGWFPAHTAQLILKYYCHLVTSMFTKTVAVHTFLQQLWSKTLNQSFWLKENCSRKKQIKYFEYMLKISSITGFNNITQGQK